MTEGLLDSSCVVLLVQSIDIIAKRDGVTRIEQCRVVHCVSRHLVPRKVPDDGLFYQDKSKSGIWNAGFGHVPTVDP